MTQTCGVFVNQVVFLTVNHRGPLPLREIHSTDETIVWRDPGGSWACLRPVHSYLSLPKAVTQTCGVFVNQVIFLTVNHRGPLPLREIHSTDETIVWRDPEGSWACLRPVQLFTPAKGCDTDMWRLCKSGRFSYGESPRTPPPEGNSPHRRNNSVERPGGSWACLRPVYY